MRRTYRIAAIVAFGVLGALPAACNVFLSLDRCSSDADCPESHVCDPEARFCVRTGAGDDSSVEASPGIDVAPDVANADADADAPEAAPPPPCDRSAPFGNHSLVKGLEDRSIFSARLTADETTLIFSAYSGCTSEPCIDLYVAKRADLGSGFTVVGQLPGVNASNTSDYWPTLTKDDLLLFFESSRSILKLPDGGWATERARVWSATRSNTTAQFSEPYVQEIFKIDATEGAPYLHPNGTSLYFMSTGRSGKGGLDLFVATLGQFGAASAIENIDSVNTAASESIPVISADDLTLYFARETPLHRIMVSTRTSTSAKFEAPTLVTELNVSKRQWPMWLSPDQCRIYFASDRGIGLDPDAGDGTIRLWSAERPK